jgi:ribosomal protein S18 acetylase RimI-like enzyme
MEALGWRLRAAIEDDEEFLRTLFAQTNVTLQSLPLELQAALLNMQYRGRELTYSTQYPEALNSIVCLDEDTCVGRLLMDRRAETFRVIDLAILPQWQGRGIGTGILKDLAQESRHRGVKLRLRVTKENRALELYLRLGFEIEGGDDISYEMSWNQNLGNPLA